MRATRGKEEEWREGVHLVVREREEEEMWLLFSTWMHAIEEKAKLME